MAGVSAPGGHDDREYRRLQAGLLALAKHDWLADASLEHSLRRITEAAGRTLGVRRAGVWRFSANRSRLECLDLCLIEGDDARHEGEDPVEAAQFPRYFAALEQDRIIDASDVRNDPRTSELADYLVAHDLVSMIDAPVRLGGRVVGVLCNEHAGAPRRWTHDEASFAASVADVVALAMEQWARRQDELARRDIERRLDETQRLESLGRLAGQIAHDFNNLLVAVLGNASLALQQLPREAPARARVAQIEVAARHASDLTRQLLAYSGRGRLATELVDLNRLIEETEAVLRASVPRGVRIEQRLAPAAPLVEADPSQLRQVVMNLIINAAESIEATGLVTISTLQRTLGEGELADAILPPPAGASGRFAVIDVADTGSGITPANLRRIFDPFYTTKPGGRGLGLSAVIGMVRGHGGAIAVDSAPGRGSRFRIFLPAVNERRPAKVAATGGGGGGEAAARTLPAGIIVVVDDEPEVREVTADMLRYLGYEVAMAADGSEALARVHELGERAAAVVLDVTMPGLDGPGALRVLRQRRPYLPVVLTSGYARQDLPTEATAGGSTVFLQKPFTVAALTAALARVSASQDAAAR